MIGTNLIGSPVDDLGVRSHRQVLEIHKKPSLSNAVHLTTDLSCIPVKTEINLELRQSAHRFFGVLCITPELSLTNSFFIVYIFCCEDFYGNLETSQTGATWLILL